MAICLRQLPEPSDDKAPLVRDAVIHHTAGSSRSITSPVLYQRMMFRAAPIFRAGLRTASCRHRGFLGFRSEHTLEQSSRRNGSGARSFRWGPAAVLILGATAGTTLYTSQTTVQADEQVTTSAIIQEPTPLGDLIRAYVVYSICSVPFLVDNSPSVLSALTAVPGIKQVSEMVVRYTFFAQVCKDIFTRATGSLAYERRLA